MAAILEDPVSLPNRKRLPFAFAKRHGVLIQDSEAETPIVIYRPGAKANSLAEARRFAGCDVKFVAVEQELFDATLQAAYESGAAMTMVEGLDEEDDLLAVAQQLPEEGLDLLNSSIRLQKRAHHLPGHSLRVQIQHLLEQIQLGAEGPIEAVA